MAFERHPAPELVALVEGEVFDAGAAQGLGVAHGRSRVVEQHVGILAILWEAGETDAAGQGDFVARPEHAVVDRVHQPAQARRQPRRLHVRAGLVEHQHEFVVAGARQRFARRQVRLQAAGDRHQHLVAGGVSQRLVDALEAVDVEAGDHGRGAAAAPVVDAGADRAQQRLAVGQAGEGVVGQQELDLVGGAGQLRAGRVVLQIVVQLRMQFLGGAGQLAVIDQLLDHARQFVQLGQSGFADLARPGVDDAQGAELGAFDRVQLHARIKADERRAGHDRVVREARVAGGVRDDQRGVGEDRVAAEGHVARGVLRRKAAARLEPLDVAADQGDQRGRHIQQLGGHARDAVEGFLGTGAEQVGRVQCGQAFCLVNRNLWFLHSSQFTGLPSGTCT